MNTFDTDRETYSMNMPPHSREDLELWELPPMKWEDMIKVKTHVVKREIYSEIKQLQELDTGPQHYQLLLLLRRNLRSLSWLQKQAKNNDSEFKGAIHLVQKMMEVGYGSQLGPATSGHDEKVVRLPNNTSTLSNNGYREARADYTRLDKPFPGGAPLGECQPSARSTNHHHHSNDKNGEVTTWSREVLMLLG